MYVRPSDLCYDAFYQGDLLKDFPFFVLEKESFTGSSDQEANNNPTVKTKLGLAILLSHTCDIQHRKNIAVCPVYKISDFNISRDELESIRKRKIGYWFYLPKLEGILEESIADFQTIYYVPRIALDNYRTNKILSLTDWGRHHLGWALTCYFGRPIEDKNK